MTPREPDRFDKQGEELACAYRTVRCPDRATLARQIAAALRAAESSALQASIDACDDAIGALQGDREVEAALECIKRIRALIPPAAAPAAECTSSGHWCVDAACPRHAAPAAETGKAETRFEKLLRVAGVRVLVEPCERGGHYLNENGVTFHPSKCVAPPEGEGT